MIWGLDVITEKLIFQGAAATSLASYAVADTLTRALPNVTKADWIALAVWVICGLLTISVALMAMVVKFVKDMRDDNREEHTTLFNHIEAPNSGLEARLSNLEGRHQSSVDARGCAYDADRLQRMVDSAVQKAFDTRRHNGRKSDVTLSGKG